MATITAPPAAESPTVRVFKGDDLPNSVLADRARYARFRATAAAAKALALAAEGGAGDECIGALAAAVEALEVREGAARPVVGFFECAQASARAARMLLSVA